MDGLGWIGWRYLDGLVWIRMDWDGLVKFDGILVPEIILSIPALWQLSTFSTLYSSIYDISCESESRIKPSIFIYFIWSPATLYHLKTDFKGTAKTIYNTVILVRSVIKFLDRNFLFIEKVKPFRFKFSEGQNMI